MAPSGQREVSAIARLTRDYECILSDPVPHIRAVPLPSNMLEWHYVVHGSQSTPYEGGVYHGKLVFPTEFPFRPPAIYMITPNGRFHVNRRLCLNISDFHPESWNPAWTVSTILAGLHSFMNSYERGVGGLRTPDSEIRLLAQKSMDFNRSDRLFCELFADIIEKEDQPSTSSSQKEKEPSDSESEYSELSD